MRETAAHPRSWTRAASLIFFALALALLLGGCAAAPPAPVVTHDPADPDVPVAHTRYKPALSGYVSRRPVEPKPWREQNDRVAPKGSAQ